jgi:hypothetical protein
MRRGGLSEQALIFRKKRQKICHNTRARAGVAICAGGAASKGFFFQKKSKKRLPRWAMDFGTVTAHAPES